MGRGSGEVEIEQASVPLGADPDVTRVVLPRRTPIHPFDRLNTTRTRIVGTYGTTELLSCRPVGMLTLDVCPTIDQDTRRLLDMISTEGPPDRVVVVSIHLHQSVAESILHGKTIVAQQRPSSTLSARDGHQDCWGNVVAGADLFE